MENFTPGASALGGVFIGLSAVLLMAGLGRIAGISGILSGLAFQPDRGWRGAFALGLVSAPIALFLLGGETPVFELTATPAVTVVAGLLVGIGVRVGSGCTSGHGVCGVSRLSPRSFAAVAIFMSLGIATATIVRIAG